MSPARADWRRLDQVLQAALEVPASERREIIVRQLSDRPDLQAVALRAIDDDGDLPNVAEMAPELIESIGRADARLHDARLAGRRLGPWEIIRPLGRGGMGAVYLGRRADGLFERQVAIKLLPTALQSEQMVSRFEREREILAGLSHPGIAQLLDGGTMDDGSPYLVLEYIDGELITDYCDRNALDLNRRLRLLVDVLEVVQYAHRNLVVHRDLKPANIMVDREGRVKLLDFGIARLLEEVGEAGLTGPLGARMTPDYAAPEQLLGSRISAASDVYALGCLTYRLLCGRVPIRLGGCSLAEMVEAVQTGRRLSMSQLLAAHAPPPGIRAGGIGRDLDAVGLRAIEADPERRYDTTAGFAADLRCLLGGLPVSARPAGPWYRAGRFIARHRAGFAVTAGVFLVLVATTTVALHQAGQAREQRDEARAVTGILNDLMQLANPDVGLGHGIDAQSVLNAALDQVLAETSKQPDTRIELLGTLAEALTAFQLFDDAVRAREAIHALQQKRFGDDHAATLSALALYARALRDQRQDFERVEALFGQLLERRRRLLGERHPDVAESYWDLGFTYLRYSDISHPGRQRVAELIGTAHEIYREVLGEHHLLAAHSLFDLGLASADQELRLERMQRAVDIRASQVDADDLLLLQHQGDLAMVLSDAGHVEEGLAMGRRAVAGYQRARGELHPVSIMLLNNLAGMYRDHERYTEALDTYRRVDELVRAVVPENHARRAYSQYGIGRTLNALGRPSEAEPFLREAIRVLEFNRRHNLIGITRVELGDSLREQGLREGAAEQYRLAASVYVDRLGRANDDAQVAAVRRRLAMLR